MKTKENKRLGAKGERRYGRGVENRRIAGRQGGLKWLDKHRKNSKRGLILLVSGSKWLSAWGGGSDRRFLENSLVKDSGTNEIRRQDRWGVKRDDLKAGLKMI